MKTAVLCLILLLLLPQCVPQGGLSNSPVATSDAGIAQPTVAPTPTVEAGVTPPIGPLATIREVFDWLVQRVGRTGLLAIVVAVIVVLVALFVILLIRMLLRSSRPAPATPPPPANSRERTAPMPPLQGGAAGQPPANHAPIPQHPPGQTAAPSGATLVMRITGEAEPPVFLLKPSGVTIGREPDNDVVIDEATPGADTISRHHARIFLEDGRWIVEDLGSQNGVYVNGRRTGRNLLQDGWTLAIGGVQFTFHNGTGRAAQ